MFKLIALVLGLAVGFGGGVYWAHRNPEAAGKLSAEEERRFLEAQLQITQKIQAKLDRLGGKSTDKTSGVGFLAPGQSGAATAADVNDVKAETQKQEQELRRHLETLK